MVIPRSRSISMESSTCSTISRSASPPVDWISRSARVDLPWSMCAMIEKLRMLSIGPAVMARGLAFARGGHKATKRARSIAIELRLVRSRHGHAGVLRLRLGELGELGADLVEVEARDL